jgi:hypothetical protein
MTIINRKEIKVCDDQGVNVFLGQHFNGGVTFLADIPKNAVVMGVVVNGKHLEDYRLDTEFGPTLSIIYPKDELLEGRRVAAVYVDETCSSDLYNGIFSGEIESFVVEYIETAVANV